ncbi:MAG: hypothetical protein H6727_02470 [Myxococcales bacterium]|nr:hypothetical protein [Myxococcales bacterium]
MRSPFESQLLQAATLLLEALQDEQIEGQIDPKSWREYSVKLQVSAQDKGIGLINLYYSPKRSGFTMRTHQINEPAQAQRIDTIWATLEDEGAFAEAAKSDTKPQGGLFTPPLVSPTPRQAAPAPTPRPSVKKRDDVDTSGLSNVYIYVDGSYMSGKIGFGWVALTPQEDHLFDEFGAITDPDLRQQRQVSGELIATQRALMWCLEKGITSAEVFYDYEGVSKWVTGAWKAKQSLTQTYRDFVRACPIKLVWHKVASHTGVRWNEFVDQLAKKGALQGRPFPLLSIADLSAMRSTKS